MTRFAAFALMALGACLPQIAAADDPKALAATIIRDVCVTTLPDFGTAIEKAVELDLLQKDSDDVAVDLDAKVSLTVTGAQELFGIKIEPLCVVSLLGHEGKDLVPTAEALAAELGSDIERNGDGLDMEEDGIVWYVNQGGQTVTLTVLEDSMLGFWKSAILSLSTEGAL